MYYFGIDWANEKHDICVMGPNGKVINQFTTSPRLFSSRAAVHAAPS
jgi:hypothetical protein